MPSGCGLLTPIGLSPTSWSATASSPTRSLVTLSRTISRSSTLTVRRPLTAWSQSSPHALALRSPSTPPVRAPSASPRLARGVGITRRTVATPRREGHAVTRPRGLLDSTATVPWPAGWARSPSARSARSRDSWFSKPFSAVRRVGANRTETRGRPCRPGAGHARSEPPDQFRHRTSLLALELQRQAGDDEGRQEDRQEPLSGTSECDGLILGCVERLGSARISAIANLHGVTSSVEGDLNGGVHLEGASTLPIHENVVATAADLRSDRLVRQLESRRHLPVHHAISVSRTIEHTHRPGRH
jgi:hypothetical protein